jgi:hypothetical protein
MEKSKRRKNFTTGAISSYTMERRDCLSDCTPCRIAGISQTSMKEKIRLTRLCHQKNIQSR